MLACLWFQRSSLWSEKEKLASFELVHNISDAKSGLIDKICDLTFFLVDCNFVIIRYAIINVN